MMVLAAASTAVAGADGQVMMTSQRQSDRCCCDCCCCSASTPTSVVRCRRRSSIITPAGHNAPTARRWSASSRHDSPSVAKAARTRTKRRRREMLPSTSTTTRCPISGWRVHSVSQSCRAGHLGFITHAKKVIFSSALVCQFVSRITQKLYSFSQNLTEMYRGRNRQTLIYSQGWVELGLRLGDSILHMGGYVLSGLCLTVTILRHKQPRRLGGMCSTQCHSGLNFPDTQQYCKRNSAIADKPRDAFRGQSMSPKRGTIPYFRYGFLLVCYSNFVREMHRF